MSALNVRMLYCVVINQPPPLPLEWTLLFRFVSIRWKQGAEAIQLGKASVALCAGAENMSSAPLVVSGNDARWETDTVARRHSNTHECRHERTNLVQSNRALRLD